MSLCNNIGFGRERKEGKVGIGLVGLTGDEEEDIGTGGSCLLSLLTVFRVCRRLCVSLACCHVHPMQVTFRYVSLISQTAALPSTHH